MVGDPVAEVAWLKTASPQENATRIKQPLLMAYGAWGVRVPLVRGEKFRHVIQPHNPGLEFVVYPKEGHGWHRVETYIAFWRCDERFPAWLFGAGIVSVALPPLKPEPRALGGCKRCECVP
jgi:dienelactone hydrolase